ncbi:MAG TPA: hypothetical protein VLD39_00545 [Gammaproteobacteria bacterium]|nr:hypothetical protein [Gammaproteobacteria bacterium]
MRKLLVAILGAALLIGSGVAFGHEEFRVIGTLTSRADSVIEVASRDGETRSIKVDRQTVITRDAEPVDVAALEAGMTLVIDAYGDSLDDLLALEIRIVPPIEN